MRRLALGIVALVLVGSLAGCRTDQLYLTHLLFEATLPAGQWTKYSCLKFPVSPFEIPAGDYAIQGDIDAANGMARFPRKILTMYQPFDADWNRAGRPMRVTIPVDRRTGMFDVIRSLGGLEVPEGGALCAYAKPKGKGLLEGQMLSYLNFYRMDPLSPPPQG